MKVRIRFNYLSGFGWSWETGIEGRFTDPTGRDCRCRIVRLGLISVRFIDRACREWTR